MPFSGPLSGAQLAALGAVLREGSFERAAATLHVTPSAVSQRIKQLEESIGAVLVVRGTPCTATRIGEAVYRHARQVELLERDLRREVEPERATSEHAPPTTIAIAVNADSLATWLMPALSGFGKTMGWAHVRIEIGVDDEDHTAQWLRSGRVVGVVTSQARPVQGCRVRPLGTMRYVACATPRFVRAWLPDGVTGRALHDAPSLAYDRKDDLCAQVLRKQFRLRDVQLHPQFVPSPHAYLDACLGGLAWGMNPGGLAAPHLRRGRLIDLLPGTTMDVPLYWQQWSIASPTVEALGEALVEHAAAELEG